MRLRNVRHLVTVAELGSIARAAAYLRLAQPALSREIRQLEEELGFAVVERERRGVRLTAAGSALVASAPAMLTQLDDAIRAAREAHAGLRGTVRVCMSRLAIDSPRVGSAMAMARAQFSGVQLEVGEMPSPDQGRALRSGAFDVAIGAFSSEETGVRQALLYEELVDTAILPASHPLVLRGSVSLADLADLLCLTVGDAHHAGYAPLYDPLWRAGFRKFEHHRSVESVYMLVAAGRGWSPVPRSVHAPVGAVLVQVEGLRSRLPLILRWRSGASSRACENVVQLLLRDLGGGSSRLRIPASSRRVARTGSRPRAAKAAKTQGIELRQLEALVATAESRSLSRAAEQMDLTQSGVSRRLRALELEVGCPLLKRMPHGVVPTDAGDALVTESREVLRQMEMALARARGVAVGTSGGAICRIGALPPELTGSLQLNVLRRVVETVPDIQLDVVELLPDAQVRALLEGAIDVGIAGHFAGLEMDHAISSVLLTEDPIDCVMLADGHPLAERAWLTAADLAREPFLFLPRPLAPGLFDALMRSFAEMGLAPQVNASFGGPRSVWRGVANSMGWTIGSRSQRSHPPPGLVAVPVEGLHVQWGISLLWRRDERDEGIRRVLEVFRETRNPEVAVVVATVRASLGPRSVTAGV